MSQAVYIVTEKRGGRVVSRRAYTNAERARQAGVSTCDEVECTTVPREHILNAVSWHHSSPLDMAITAYNARQARELAS